MKVFFYLQNISFYNHVSNITVTYQIKMNFKFVLLANHDSNSHKHITVL